VSTWQPPSGPAQPFPQPNYGQAPYGQQQPYLPSGVPPYDPQPNKSSGWWLWVLLGVGGLLFLCCGGGVIGVGVFGMNIVAADVKEQVRDNPKLREHIGEIQTFTFDWVASAAKDDGETFVYNVKGDKGSGTLTVKQVQDDDWNEVVEEASLRLPDGTTVQIVP
jgi:hypothetical protein